MTIIAHRQLDGVVTDQDRHGAAHPIAVAHGVRHGLNRDPVGGGLDRGRQRAAQIRPVDVDLQIAGQRRSPGPHRSEQAEFVQGRRSQRLDETPYVGEAGCHLSVDFAQQPTSRGLRRDLARGQPRLEADGRERRSQSVVEIAPQPAPLILPQGDNLGARAEQILMQPYGLDRGTYLTGKRANELKIGRLQRIVAATLRNPQPTDSVSVVHECLGVHSSHRRTVFGSQPKLARAVGEVDRDIRQPE